MSLPDLLMQTLNPTAQKEATNSLLLIAETQPQSLLAVMELIASQNSTLAHIAAVFLKNAINKHYHQSDYMSQEERALFKQKLLESLLNQNLNNIVKQQISVSISSVADTDCWVDLPQILGSHLSTANLETQMLLLDTIHLYVVIWRKFDLNANIIVDIQNAVSNFFVPILLPYLESIFSDFPSLLQIEQFDLNFSLFLNFSKIFNCFVFHDIPEDLVAFIPRCCEIFCFFLQWSHPQYKLHEQNLMHESTQLTKLRGSILDNVYILISKYLEDISSFQNSIISAVWHLILEYSYTAEESLSQTTLTTSTRDVMISKALNVISLCISNNCGYEVFVGNGNTEAIDYLVSKVIVGNTLVRREDLNSFEDEALVYALRELEGSDINSINKSTFELVKAFIDKSPFSDAIVESCLRYVGNFIQLYNKNDPNSWKYKSTASRLICSVCTNSKHSQIPIDFLNQHILPDLTNSTSPFLLADALYFITHFKELFAKNDLVKVVNSCVEILQQQATSPNTVVCTFACNAIECIIKKHFNAQGVNQICQSLFQSVFSILNKKEGLYLSENEYYLKVIVRCLMILQDGVKEYSTLLMQQFLRYVEQVGQNPVNPKFNHVLFEAIGMTTRFSCKNDPSATILFDQQLVPIFITILDLNISEFNPYIFQILTVLLECHAPGDVPIQLEQLLPMLVKPDVWKSHSNVQSLVRFFGAYMVICPSLFSKLNLLVPLLGVFQNLLNSRINEPFGMKLLIFMFHYIPFDQFKENMQPLFSILLTKLQNHRARFGIEFTRLISYLLAHPSFGPTFLISTMEGIQQG